MRPRYSVSSLLTYEACPWQYYYQYVLGLPPPRTPAMARGVSVHSLISRHYRSKPLPGTLDPEVERLFRAFQESRFNVPPIASEKTFLLPLERGDVRGRMDIVLPAESGGVELVDIKSGTGRAREDVGRHLQLPLYATAASQIFGVDPEAVSYTYLFLGNGEEHTFAFNEESDQAVRMRVNGLVANIQAGRFDADPSCGCFACERKRRGRGSLVTGV